MISSEHDPEEQQARSIHTLSVKLVACADSPDVSHYTADGVFIKQLFFPRPKIFMGQHAHAHAHALMIAFGEVRLWVDGVERGDFGEGDCIHVEAGKKHTLMSLKKAIGYCIHNLHGLEEVEIKERAEMPA